MDRWYILLLPSADRSMYTLLANSRTTIPSRGRGIHESTTSIHHGGHVCAHLAVLDERGARTNLDSDHHWNRGRLERRHGYRREDHRHQRGDEPHRAGRD